MYYNEVLGDYLDMPLIYVRTLASRHTEMATQGGDVFKSKT